MKKVTRLPTAARRPVRNRVALGEDEGVAFIRWPTRLDLPVERILHCAQRADLSAAVVIGFDAQGELFFASSKADGGDALWLLELAKKRLLAVGDDR